MDDVLPDPPAVCPACASRLLITRLHCPSCGTEVSGAYGLRALAGLPEPHATLIELFLRARGNMKEIERELGLSYPTVRARLEEALLAAGFERSGREAEERQLALARSAVLDQLERGEISASDATERLRELKSRRTS